MKIQEQIINIENGIEYWKIYFELTNERQLTLTEWELINSKINKMIYQFNEQKNNFNTGQVKEEIQKL